MKAISNYGMLDILEAQFDPKFLAAFLFLLGLGVVMVASTTLEMSQARYDDAFYLFRKQLAFIGLGLITIWVLRSIRLSFWERFAPSILFVSIALLIGVLIPGLGHGSHGSFRWLSIGGINIQISEFAKLAMIIYLSGYLVRHHERMKSELGAFMVPLAVVAVMDVLLLLEPDFGAAVVLTMIVLAMLYLGGVRYIPFVFVGLVAVVGLLLVAITKEYRMDRLMAFVDPWSDPMNTGYQLTQSLIAIGDGGVWGAGLGSSVQKLFYLPEAHNDFVFAVLAEELGMVGVILLLGAYFVLIKCSFQLAGKCADSGMRFAQYLMSGCAIWFSLQIIVSLGVNMGLLPTKGLSLPFLSAGGSNLLASCTAVGLMMRVYLEHQQWAGGVKQAAGKRRG